MNAKFIFIIAAIVAAGAFWWFFYATDSSKTEQSAATTTSKESTSSAKPSGDKNFEDSSKETTIMYTDSGYEPKSVTVKAGGTILWVNSSSSTIQIGSNDHPTHLNNQEITGNEFVIELAPGESRSLQLTKKGEWGYHDHLRPSMTGTILVD